MLKKRYIQKGRYKRIIGGAEESDKTFGNAFGYQLGAALSRSLFENCFPVVFDRMERNKKLFGNFFVL